MTWILISDWMTRITLEPFNRFEKILCVHVTYWGWHLGLLGAYIWVCCYRHAPTFKSHCRDFVSRSLAGRDFDLDKLVGWLLWYHLPIAAGLSTRYSVVTVACPWTRLIEKTNWYCMLFWTGLFKKNVRISPICGSRYVSDHVMLCYVCIPIDAVHFDINFHKYQ